MKQTNSEADEALAHVRQTTAAPIQRFLDSIASARLEETTGRRDGVVDGPSSPDRSGVAQGLRRFSEALGVSLKAVPRMRPLACVIRRICRRG
jgi:hypothetical protein